MAAIADAHHGRVSAAPGPEGGATFRVELPLAPPVASRPMRRFAFPGRDDEARRNVRRVSIAKLISQAGSGAAWIALVAIVYDRTDGSGVWLAAALVRLVRGARRGGAVGRRAAATGPTGGR